MAEIDYLNVLALTAVAVAAPLVAGALPLAIPEVVLQIAGGIVLGPSVLDWVHVDAGVEILSALGLAYLLFISGMEIEVETLRGKLLPLGLRAFGVSLAIAIVAAFALRGAGLIHNRGLVVAALITTSLGIVVTVLKDREEHASELGQLTLLSASLGDFGSVALLSVIFADQSSGPVLPIVFLTLFGFATLLLIGAILHARPVDRLATAFTQRAGPASQLAVRASFALMVGFAALADSLGLEAILGAFAAGIVVSVLGSGATELRSTRATLEAVGFGVLAPLFFVTSGLRFDLQALAGSSEAMLLVPLLFLMMTLTRMTPTLLFRPVLGDRRAAISGLLLSTKLTFVVAAVEIGRDADAIEPSVAAALIAAAVLTVLTLPTAASTLLATERATA